MQHSGTELFISLFMTNEERMILLNFSLPDLTITKMVEVLKTQIQSGASLSRIKALTWIQNLFECLQEKVRNSISFEKHFE